MNEWSVPAAERRALLLAIPGFAPLPGAASTVLVDALVEQRYAAGEVVLAEGTAGDALYLMVTGRAEVTTGGPAGPTVLATLEEGESFGEIALLSPERQRTATVTALTPLLTLRLDASVFDAVLRASPESQAAFAATARALLIHKLLKQASPFAHLDPVRSQALAARLEEIAVPAGVTIIRQGERGDRCYLIISGAMEVVLAVGEAGERRLTTLAAGHLVGEAALLTDAPRNASVRALEASRLAVLRRADLLEALHSDEQVQTRLLDLLRLRALPRQAPNILAQVRRTPESETMIILKDATRGVYYRLSERGWFLWQRLDGQHTVRDLTLDYLTAFKTFAPHQVVEIVGGLIAAGFAQVPGLREDVAAPVRPATTGQRALSRVRGVLEWRWTVGGVDGVVTRLYRSPWLRWIYTRPGLALLALLAIAGLIAFWGEGGRATTEQGGLAHHPALALLAIPAFVLSILGHEAGHALTVKACGREVPRVGIGWYWFTPIAFVDTSDMWLAERWQQLAVSFAGPLANLVLGSLSALPALLVTSPLVLAALWQYALVSYLGFLLNLNPLLEYDGYYIVMDLLRRPNLRRHALQWWGHNFPAALWRPRTLWRHRVEALYGLGTLLYIAAVALTIVVLYRLTIQQWLTGVLPGGWAAALAWLLAAIVVLGALLGILGDLRGARSPDGSR